MHTPNVRKWLARRNAEGARHVTMLEARRRFPAIPAKRMGTILRHLGSQRFRTHVGGKSRYVWSMPDLAHTPEELIDRAMQEWLDALPPHTRWFQMHQIGLDTMPPHCNRKTIGASLRRLGCRRGNKREGTETFAGWFTPDHNRV